jgi:hypothetical protein
MPGTCSSIVVAILFAIIVVSPATGSIRIAMKTVMRMGR